MSAARASALGAEQPQRRHRGHELGAVHERQALLGEEPDRREPDAAERVRAGEQLALDPGLALADERKRQVGERRQVARGADRAAARHVRQHAAQDALDQQAGDLRPRARVALRQRVRAEQHRRAHHLGRVGLSDAAGMAAEQAHLQLFRQLLRDGLRDEAAEPRVDAVGVLGRPVRRALDELTRRRHPRPRGVGELDRPALDGDRPDVLDGEVVPRQDGGREHVAESSPAVDTLSAQTCHPRVRRSRLPSIPEGGPRPAPGTGPVGTCPGVRGRGAGGLGAEARADATRRTRRSAVRGPQRQRPPPLA